MLDPEGEIRKKVNRYLSIFPRASFEEVERECFPGLDGKHAFTAISPRNIEAALAGTVQIATVGDYNGILKKDEHYIALDPDCANIREVSQIMKNRTETKKIAQKCKEAILSVDDLRAKNHASRLISHIREGNSCNTKSYDDSKMKKTVEKYELEMALIQEKYWKKARRISRFKDVTILFGAKRLQHLLGR